MNIKSCKKLPNNNFIGINVGDDISWSDNLLHALNILKKKYCYVLLLFDDGFITSVNANNIVKFLNEFINICGNSLTYINQPKHTKNYNEDFGEIESTSRYRTTATFCVWRIDLLMEILKKGESDLNKFHTFV